MTLALAHGWSEDAIMRRTGHTTSGQLRNYRRDAENLREVWRRGGWAELQTSGALIGEGPTQLLPLWQAIPELREVVESGVLGDAEPTGAKVPLRATTSRKNSNKSTGGEIGRRSGLRLPDGVAGNSWDRGRRLDSEPSGSEIERVRDGAGHSLPIPGSVEEALAFAVVQASAAAQWAVVAQLARELEARRLAATGGVGLGGGSKR